MPDLKVSKGPPNSSPGESGENLRVLIHVDSVVVIDEPMVDRLAKDSPNDDHQKDADSHYGKAIVARMGQSRRLFAQTVLQVTCHRQWCSMPSIASAEEKRANFAKALA